MRHDHIGTAEQSEVNMAQKRRFELEGLKFEIGKLTIDVSGDDGEKQIKEALAENLGLALAPVAQAMRAQLPAAPAQQVPTPVAVNGEDRRATRRTRRAANGPSPSGGVALDWKPDIQKYGNPTTEWSTADRALWLLGCYAKDHPADATAGLSQPAIIAVFRKHFSHLNEIIYSNLKRDMKKLASAERPKIQVDRTKAPAIWSLTDAGKAYVDDIIKRATSPSLAGVA